MNILMVGHSGAGKTSFMAGMYRLLGENSDGYGIVAKNYSQKKQLEKMAQLLENGKYPAGTDVQQVYNFSLTCNGEEIIPFNWMDYRGGILLSEDPDDEDVQKFTNAINSADALVVFLDGEKLSDDTGKWIFEYDLLLTCIMNSLDIEHQSWFPISFVITKCDLLPNGAVFHGLDRFDSLLSQIKDSKTIGASLVRCAINKYNYVVPFYTLAYCIYGGTPIYVRKRQLAIENAQQRQREHEATSILGFLGHVAEEVLNGAAEIFDSGWETEWDKENRAVRDYNVESAKLQLLQSIADELKDKLIKWSEEDEIIFF